MTASATIIGGAGGTLLNNVRTSANGGTNTFGLDTTTPFTPYLLTTRAGGQTNFLGAGGQGYALSQITATVTEPATWPLLILGFGMVGVAACRRQTGHVAA